MTPVSRKVGQFWTKVQQETYSEIAKKKHEKKDAGLDKLGLFIKDPDLTKKEVLEYKEKNSPSTRRFTVDTNFGREGRSAWIR